MFPPDPALSPEAHPVLTALLYASAGLYVLSLGLSTVRPAHGRWVLATGAGVHLFATVGRGWAIGFFPLTNKFESFSAAALALALVTLASWRPARTYCLPLLALTVLAIAAALRFPLNLSYPPPLMRTIWYPLHVPLSFLSYALWAASAAASLTWAFNREPEWLRRVDLLALQGFGIWSASMVFGGLWGVVSWGAYFLWDPKVVWSVILWFHYATFVHLRLTPSMRGRPWVRPVAAVVGLVFVFVAYVGTSFLFGNSSHAF